MTAAQTPVCNDPGGSREAISVYVFEPKKGGRLIGKESVRYASLWGGEGFGGDAEYAERALNYAYPYPDHIVKLFVVSENVAYSYRTRGGARDRASVLFLGKSNGRTEEFQ